MEADNLLKKSMEKEEDLKVVKSSMKGQNSEICLMINELRHASKNIKSKEKEIFALTTRNENIAENLKRVKFDYSKIVTEKKKLEKVQNKS